MIVSTYPDVPSPEGARPAVSLGNFDGVHRGHQRILEELLARARARGAPAVAVTFEPHPVSVLRPDDAPSRILTPRAKEEILATTGIDHLVVIPFTHEFSRMEAEEFVARVLVERLRARELVLGGNFRFGRDRKGDLALLRREGARYGFSVVEVPPALYDGAMISSSRIRRALAEGALSDAAAMLGRPYFVDGRVVPGDGRGRALGYPTANLDVEGDVLVPDGVYVASARTGDRVYGAMAHIGRRPTFGDPRRVVEAHLFDFEGELYGRPLRLYFHARIRPTETFSGPDELRRRLDRDREEALAYLERHGGNLPL